MKCILHIREGECEGNIKPFLENRSLWEKVCASAQFGQQRKEEKKENKVRSNHWLHSNLVNSIIWLSQSCYRKFTAISKPKIKAKTSTRSTKVSTRSENTSPLLPSATGVLPLYVYFVIKEGKKLEVHGKNLQKLKNMKLKKLFEIKPRCWMMNQWS